MTILHISTPTSWRGGEQQVAYLVTALRDKGIEQVVLSIERSILSQRLMEVDIPVASFPSRGFMGIALAKRIMQICRTKSFDVIHCHDSHAHSAAVVSASLFGNKVPVVISRRVDFAVSSNPLSKWKYNHPIVKRIICVSDTIKRITSPAIRNKNKLAVIHSGIDLSKYAKGSLSKMLHGELGLSPSTKLIGNLSALADHKDYPTFLRTAAAIITKDPTIHFIIAGEGPEEKNIKKLIASQKLFNHVHLLGFRKDIVEVMQSLDLFLITSVTEGLGTIVLEAFAAGVPVVGTRAGGIPEMVEDSITGLLADPKDVDGLSTACLRILKDPELNNTLAANAMNKVKDFSFQATAEKTLIMYRTVL